MSKHTTKSVLATAALMLAACGSESPPAEGTPSEPAAEAPAPAVTYTTSRPRTSDDVNVTMQAACYMRNTTGEVWYIAKATEVQIPARSSDLKGPAKEAFVAKIRAERPASEIGDSPMNPTCFVDFKPESVNAQIDRFTTASKEPGMKIVKIKF